MGRCAATLHYHSQTALRLLSCVLKRSHGVRRGVIFSEYQRHTVMSEVSERSVLLRVLKVRLIVFLQLAVPIGTVVFCMECVLN